MNVRKLIDGGMIQLALLCFAATALFAGSDANDWPKWRGQNQDGKAVESDVFKFDEGYGLKIAWKKPLGSSYSSISVADGRAVTMFSDSTYDYIVALDTKDGDELWRYRIDSTYVGHTGSHDGQISTPIIDNGNVYLYTRKGDLLALDVESGNVVWSHGVEQEFNSLEPFHGYGSSPVIVDDVLIVEVGGQDGNAIAGFDKKTGKELWSTGRDTINYQSPIALDVDGKTQLLCVGDKYVQAQVPQTGETLWEYRHNGGWGSINPVMVGKDKLFLNHSFQQSMLLQVRNSDGEYDPKELWTTRDIRQTFNTSVYHDGYIYGYSSRFLSCIDAETGESAWKSRQPGDGFIILVDEHLVIMTKNGTLHIAETSSEGYKELASIELFDSLTWTPASFANGRIYARSLQDIAAVDIAPVDQLTMAEDDVTFELLNPDGEFSQMVQKLQAAPPAERKAIAKAYIEKQESFPIIEDDKYAHIVHFGDAEDVGLLGDMLPSGQEVAMNHVPGSGLFFSSFELEPDARLDYILRHNFDNIITDPRNPHTVPSYTTPIQKASELRMPEWERPTHFDEPASDVARGEMTTFEFESDVFDNKRNVHVYTPAGYAESGKSYPTVYVNYGNFAKDMAMMPNTLDNMIAQGRIEPVIAVFVEAPQSFQVYARNGRDQHAKMFVEELIPHIDKNYRTKADADHRLLMGADEGGYAAIYAAFKYPGTASMLAGQSTHLFPGAGGEEINAIVDNSERLDVDFYLDWSTYDQRGGNFDWKDMNRDFAKKLRAKGYDVSSKEVHEGFGWASWRNRTDEILEHFFAPKTSMN